jgi:hypothetical protein
MKKLLRRWLSIDELLKNQEAIYFRYEELVQYNSQISDKLEMILEQDLNENLKKVEFNVSRVNQMLLELKGVVAMARAMLDQGKTKPM